VLKYQKEETVRLFGTAQCIPVQITPY